MIYLLLGVLVIVVMLALAYVSLFVGGHVHAPADDVGRSRASPGTTPLATSPETPPETSP